LDEGGLAAAEDDDPFLDESQECCRHLDSVCGVLISYADFVRAIPRPIAVDQ
jgi:hypothetical protein